MQWCRSLNIMCALGTYVFVKVLRELNRSFSSSIASAFGIALGMALVLILVHSFDGGLFKPKVRASPHIWQATYITKYYTAEHPSQLGSEYYLSSCKDGK